MNKVILYGKIMNDVDTRPTSNGNNISRFTLGTSKKIKDEWQNKYVPITCFGKMSDLASNYLKKDQHLLVEAEISNRSWEDKEGKKQYSLDVVAYNFTFAQKEAANENTQEKIPF